MLPEMAVASAWLSSFDALICILVTSCRIPRKSSTSASFRILDWLADSSEASTSRARYSSPAPASNLASMFWAMLSTRRYSDAMRNFSTSVTDMAAVIAPAETKKAMWTSCSKPPMAELIALAELDPAGPPGVGSKPD